MDRFENNLWFCDSEVFAHDWLWVFQSYDKPNLIYSFHNDSNNLSKFLEDNKVLVGYNIKGYDQYILKACLLNYTPETVKEVNDWIVRDKLQGWEYPFNGYCAIPPILDLMLDIVPRKSLKEIEGNLFMDITETTIPFDYDKVWDSGVYNEILKYCLADVEALRPLYEARKTYIQTKVNLAEMADLDCIKALRQTNAQLVADFLGAIKIEHNPNEIYTFPKKLRKDLIPQDILNFYSTMESRFNADGTVNENASSSYNVDIANCPHKLGFGGLHGALNNYIEVANDNRIILNFDVFSYYPSIMIIYGYLSRNITNFQRFLEVYEMRKEAKFNPNSNIPKELVATGKLVMNTTFGASLAKFNNLYDPLMGKSVCVAGQCFLITLITKLKEISSYKHIQSNTDGIMFSIDISDYQQTLSIVKAWENETGFIMEEDKIQAVYQRDVNNYLIVMDNDNIKSKGSVFSALNKKDYESNSIKIVSQAILDFFVKNIPVADTINSCNEMQAFQIVAKTGSTYDGTIHYIDGKPILLTHKVNRIYATKNDKYGVVKKLKTTNQPTITVERKKKGVKVDEVVDLPKLTDTVFILRADTIANCPQKAIIDNENQLTIDAIDKDWYITYAEKEIVKFKGGNKKMATKKTKTVTAEEQVVVQEEREALERDLQNTQFATSSSKVKVDTPLQPIDLFGLQRLNFYRKRAKIRKFISEYNLERDGYNTHQKYEYVKAWQYKAMLNAACLANNMEFIVEMEQVETLPCLKSESMVLTRVFGTILFIDLDTGYGESVRVVADGADNLDKGIYKAETMLIKSFVQLQFLRADNDELDVENDGSKQPTAPKFTQPATRAEAKTQVINTVEKPSKEFVDELVRRILDIRSVEKDYLKNSEIIEKINNNTISKSEAALLSVEIDDKIDELNLYKGV